MIRRPTRSTRTDTLFPYTTLFRSGVPRNPEIPANADASYYDLGLCGPMRTDQHDNQNYCGLFKTPSLRNVAERGAFFHNGRFHTLRSEEHTSELQSLMRISYAVFCLKKKNVTNCNIADQTKT